MAFNSNQNIVEEAKSLLQLLGVPSSQYTDGALGSYSPINGELIGGISETTPEETDQICESVVPKRRDTGQKRGTRPGSMNNFLDGHEPSNQS